MLKFKKGYKKAVMILPDHLMHPPIDGVAAREELAVFLAKTTEESQRFNEKRELHFERLIARGQEPLRIIK